MRSVRSRRSVSASTAHLVKGGMVLVSRCDPDESECKMGYCKCRTTRDEAEIMHYTESADSCDVKVLAGPAAGNQLTVPVQFVFASDPPASATPLNTQGHSSKAPTQSKQMTPVAFSLPAASPVAAAGDLLLAS